MIRANFCDKCDTPTDSPENDCGEFLCTECADNAAERAWERHCTSSYDSYQQQQIEARRLK